MAKKKPIKKKSAPKKRTPAKKKTPAKRKLTKRSGSKKAKKKGGVVSRVIGKIPSRYKIKGGRSKYKTKHGTVETSYEDLEVGN